MHILGANPFLQATVGQINDDKNNIQNRFFFLLFLFRSLVLACLEVCVQQNRNRINRQLEVSYIIVYLHICPLVRKKGVFSENFHMFCVVLVLFCLSVVL